MPDSEAMRRSRRRGNLLFAGACVLGLSVVVGGCAVGCAVGCRHQYSDGKRVGTVTKFSRKGVFLKSWEGEMALSGLRGGEHGPAANLWEFTATDPAVIEQLQAVQESAQTARLHYTQTLFYNPFVRDTTYTVNKAEVLGGGEVSQ
jgi:hypothetical protein